MPGSTASFATAYTALEISHIRSTSRRLAAVFRVLSEYMRPGRSGLDIQRFVARCFKRKGLMSAQAGHRGFPHLISVSPEDVAVHGVPDGVPIQAGSLVTVDITVRRDGWCSDAAWTYAVGPIDASRARLLKAAYACCMAGISTIRDGVDVSVVGATVNRVAKHYGVSVCNECSGHGIGREMHEPPHYRYTDMPSGVRLVRGNVITVEPVVSTSPTRLLSGGDEFSLRSENGAICAQFEHTVAVLRDEPELLTAQAGVDVDFPPFF